MLEEIKSGVELHRVFSDEVAARNYLEYHLWGSEPKCPWCAGSKYYNLKSKKQPYYCPSCRRNYSIRSGTIFANSNIPLRLWLIGIWKVLNSTRSHCNIYELTKEVGITEATAWSMLHRIRHLFKTDEVEKFDGTNQADEVYIGPDITKMSKKRRAKAPKGRGCKGKLPIVGIYNTETGRSKYVVCKRGETVKEDTVSEILDKYVEKSSVLVTDAAPIYTNCGKKQSRHIALNHKKRQFGEDGYHSNGIEGSFKHVKDMVKSEHKGRINDWHMVRYVDEFEYKKNMEKEKRDYVVAVKKGMDVEKPMSLDPQRLRRELPYKELVKDSQNPRRGKRSGKN